jgi:hypothetical protein
MDMVWHDATAQPSREAKRRIWARHIFEVDPPGKKYGRGKNTGTDRLFVVIGR